MTHPPGMDHAEAVTHALLALARAYLAGKPGQGAYPAEARAEDYARAILREMQTDEGRAKRCAMLEDRVDGVLLPPGVVLHLLADAVALPDALRRLEASEREAEEFIGHVSRALEAFNDPRTKGAEAQARAAVRAIGITGRRRDDRAAFLADYERRLSGYFDPETGRHVAAVERAEALQQTAAHFGKTPTAMHKAIAREIRRRRDAGHQVPPLLPQNPG